MPGMFEVSYETHFCSAHALREYKGMTEPTHGHNFRLIVTVTGERLDSAGILIDFLDLKESVDAETQRLHYCFLNETVDEFKAGKVGLSPSAENIAFVVFQRLKKQLMESAGVPKDVKLASVQVFESPGCSATYRE